MQDKNIFKTISTNKILFLIVSIITLVGCFVFPIQSAQAATRTWSGAVSNLWNVAGNWTEGIVPTTGDDLVFPLTPTGNKSNSNDITADTSFNSITIQGTGYTLAGNRITLGAGGIVQTTGTNTISLAIVLGANVTVSVSGLDGLWLTGVISDGVGSAVAKTGTAYLYSTGAHTFSGGLTIKAGIIRGSTSAWAFGGSGNGLITIGDTSGSANAYAYAQLVTVANPISVASGSSGVSGLIGYSGAFTGNIVLNKNLSLLGVDGYQLNLSGAITGTGNISIDQSAVTISGTCNHVGTIINNGSGTYASTISAVIGTNVTGVVQNSATSALTLSGANTFTGGLTIKAGICLLSTSASAGGGSGTGSIALGDTGGTANAEIWTTSNLTFANPVSVVAGSSGVLSLRSEGTANVFSGAITLANNLTLKMTGQVSLGITGGIAGTGNVTSSISGTGSISISGTTVNHAGTITNSGTGTGTTMISAVIGTNVTGVIQNSATSVLILNGANTWTGGLAIKAGTVLTENSNALGANTNIVTIGDTSGTADATLLLRATYTYMNPVTVASGSNGILTIKSTTGNAYLGGVVTLTNNLTVASTSSGSVNFQAGIVGTGNLNIVNSSTGPTTITIASLNHTGTITNSGTGTGTTTISAVIGTNVTGITQNSSTSKLLLSGNNSNTGNVTISAGTLELLGTTNLNVTGNWNNQGTFTKNTSTVSLTGATQSITGSTTFNNLTFTPGQTITFQGSSTQTISNTLTCQGSAGNIITLASSNTTPAILSKSSGQVVCDYLNVSYSTAQGGATWNPGAHSTNQGSNTGWDFTAPSTTATAVHNPHNTGQVTYTFDTITSSTNVTVTLTCQDNTGGTGCDSSYPKYCQDTTNTCDPITQGTSYTTPVIISTENTSYIRYYSQDQVPNIESIIQSKTIKIDTTSPTFANVFNQLSLNNIKVTWDTSEIASTQFNYGLTNSYENQGTETDTTQRVLSHTTGLLPIEPCKRYYAQALSTDLYQNQGTYNFFINTSCGGGAQVFPEFNQPEVKKQVIDNENEMQRLQAIIEKLKAQIIALIKKNTPQSIITPNIPIADTPKNTPESPSSFQFTSTLKLGSMGSEVKELQIKLKQLGFLANTITPNGVFGKATLKALQDFQTQNNITSPNIYGYGIMGPRTRGVLNKVR